MTDDDHTTFVVEPCLSRPECRSKRLLCPWHVCIDHMVQAIIDSGADAAVVKHELPSHEWPWTGRLVDVV